MKSPRLPTLAAATFAALTISSSAVAQAPSQPVKPASDSLAVEVDSTPQHNWLVNVVRKVTFRGDDSAPDSATATNAAAPARRIRRTVAIVTVIVIVIAISFVITTAIMIGIGTNEVIAIADEPFPG